MFIMHHSRMFPATSPRNFRRLMLAPKAQETVIVAAQVGSLEGVVDVRFGSGTDIRPLSHDVSFTPNSGHQAVICDVR
jgi:hypothetical protein